MDESRPASERQSLMIELLDQSEEAELFEPAIRNVLIPSGARIDLGKVEAVRVLAEDLEDPEALRRRRRRSIRRPRAGQPRRVDGGLGIVPSSAGDRRLEEVELRSFLFHRLPP